MMTTLQKDMNKQGDGDMANNIGKISDRSIRLPNISSKIFPFTLNPQFIAIKVIVIKLG